MNRTGRNGALLAGAGLMVLAPLAIALGQASEDDSALTAKGRAVLVDVLANDTGVATPQLLRVQTQPAHGSAQVVGDGIRYVPAPGFTGRDRFSYFVKKGRQVGLASVTVDVGEALLLRGKVTDAPIANATVQASVDGNHFTAQADADGDYSLEIIGLEGGMVTLGAQGHGPQSMVNFLSVLGDFDRVLAEAGADGELSRDENNQVQVTNVSTAQAYLLQVANGGAPVTDDVELAVARENIDNGQLMTMAAAIKLAVDEGYALPDGTSDTLALISDPDALDAFVAAVNAEDPDAIGETMNLIASDPNLTVPTDAEDLFGTYTLVRELGMAGTINTRFIQGERLTLEAGGGGSYISSVPNPDPALSWTFDDSTGRAVATPVNPMVLTSYPVLEGIGQVRQLRQVTGIAVARLFEGSGRDTLAVTQTFVYSYPDNPELEGGTWTSTGSSLGIRDEGGIVPFTAAELAGTTRSMWISGTSYYNSNYTGSALFSFDAGGVGERGDGVAFGWDVDALGRLQVAYADGTQSAYARVSEDGRKGEGLAGQWLGGDGTHSASVSISAIADGFAFTTGNVQGDWRSGQFISGSFASTTPDNRDFFMVFGPGQAGWHVTYGDDAAWPVAIGWTLAGGGVDAIYYRDGNNLPVHACQPGVDGCYIWQIRRWDPVAMDGNRAYVIESFLVDFEGDGSFDVVTQRGNFYDAVDAPPFAMAPAPAKAPAKAKKAEPARVPPAPRR